MSYAESAVFSPVSGENTSEDRSEYLLVFGCAIGLPLKPNEIDVWSTYPKVTELYQLLLSE